MKTASEKGVSKCIRILQMIVGIIIISLSITIIHYHKQSLSSSLSKTTNYLNFLYFSTIIGALSFCYIFACTTIILADVQNTTISTPINTLSDTANTFKVNQKEWVNI